MHYTIVGYFLRMFNLIFFFDIACPYSITFHTGDSMRPVTSDDLSRLQYLTCVVKETLRLIPSVPSIFRKLDEDIMLGNSIYR